MRKKSLIKVKGSKRRAANRQSRKQLKKMLFFILSYLRCFIEFIIDKLFGLYYDSKKEIAPPTKDPILLQSVTALTQSIREGNLKCEQIVRAFIERAKEVQPIINSIVDERFNDAIEDAKRIDNDIASGKITEADFKRKPLLGIPFTSKDSTSCKGMLYTWGIVPRKNVRATEDAVVITQFKDAGAILIATTNIPEVNMWQETRNNLFGQTKNPYNTTRTTGGSSGGEASLIAACGTAMGIGTDIGGSLRMPAYFCGIFAHKPTHDLVSLRGLTDRTGAEKNSMCTAGPMCRYSSDLTLMLNVLTNNQLKLNKSVDINDIEFYYMPESNDTRISHASSEVRDIMDKVVSFLSKTLKNAEHMPKEVHFEQVQYSFRLWRHEMTKEPLDFAAALTHNKGRVNVYTEFVKKLLGQSIYTFPAIMNLVNLHVFPQEDPVWAEKNLTDLKSDVLKTLGKNGVLIFPSFPSTAPYHYLQILRPYNMSTWAVFNALRLPVTQVPLGVSVDGLPLGVQIVTAPYNDHLAIAVAKVLEEEFGGWVPFLDNTKED